MVINLLATKTENTVNELLPQNQYHQKKKEEERIPLLKPPNSQGLLENLEVLATFQQAPTACQEEIDY
jgi:hypothetical protein